MFAAMMEGILYLKSTKMNLKLNNTNQLVAIYEPLVYKKRLQNNRQKQSLYGLSRRKRIRRNLVLLHSNDSTRILTTCKSPSLLSCTKDMRERERDDHTNLDVRETSSDHARGYNADGMHRSLSALHVQQHHIVVQCATPGRALLMDVSR